jgi:hypothetical protein
MNRRGLLPVAVLAAVLLLGRGAQGGERGKLRLEFSGGGMTLDPAGLNQAADTDDAVHYLRYEHYLEWLRSGGNIESWSATTSGERRRINAGWLLEPRLRCQLGGSFSLSLGMRILRSGRSQDISGEYIRELGEGERYVETLVFSPYRLAVRGYWPSAGIHFRRRLGRRFAAEGYAAAGPLFAGVSYRSAWTYAWDMRGAEYTWPVFRDAGGRSEKGSGTGYGLELGARIERALGSRLAVFLAGGYSWQRVNSLSGSGEEARAGAVDSWSGKWVTRSETIVTPWETLPVRFPTCRPQAGADDGPFRLDLSGWYLRGGLSWRI